jgi:hypothetical protein
MKSGCSIKKGTSGMLAQGMDNLEYDLPHITKQMFVYQRNLDYMIIELLLN